MSASHHLSSAAISDGIALRTPGHARPDKEAANVAVAVRQPGVERRHGCLLALALAAADAHDTKRIVDGAAARCAAHA